MSQAPVHVVPYDPSWVDKFESEQASLAMLLAPWRSGPIEHVGSTAVVGMWAKPVIDREYQRPVPEQRLMDVRHRLLSA